MYSSALVALDLEDEAGSQLMAHRCRSLIAGRPMPLHFVYVRTPLPRSYLAQLPKDWEMINRSDAEGQLRRYAEQQDLSPQLAGVHAPAGSIAREVTNLARLLAVEVICVAAHRLDLGRLLLGTNTHAIVRDAPCDVIVAREVMKDDAQN